MDMKDQFAALLAEYPKFQAAAREAIGGMNAAQARFLQDLLAQVDRHFTDLQNEMPVAMSELDAETERIRQSLAETETRLANALKEPPVIPPPPTPEPTPESNAWPLDRALGRKIRDEVVDRFGPFPPGDEIEPEIWEGK